MEATWLEAPFLYFAVSDSGQIRHVNNRLCQALGYTQQELTGQKLDVIYTLASRIFHQTHFFPLLKLHGAAEEIYITLKAKDGQELPVLINAERKQQGEEAISSYAGIVVQNRKKFETELVAARKAAEAAINENTVLIEAKKLAQQQAEALDKQMQMVQRQNDELTQFSSVVTHDLQEPLRKLFVFTNMLVENDDEETRAKVVGKIASAATHLRSVVTGLQQYVWLTDTALQPVVIDLNSLVKMAAGKIKQQFPDVILSVEAEGLPTLTADMEQMLFLLQEIMGNAVRFRKPGNKVRIVMTANRLLQNQFKSVPGKYKYVDYLKLDITDDGLGMKTQYQGQALELFKRLHPESGRGVGLSLCKKIVENHGGSMELNSRENEGTTITVWLPLLKEEDASLTKSDKVNLTLK